MPTYEFECDQCDVRHSTTRRMSEAGEPFQCPKCGGPTRRIFFAAPVTWHTDGAHVTDYGRGNHIGTKNDELNRIWSKQFGEAPPPPASDVPKNSGEKF